MKSKSLLALSAGFAIATGMLASASASTSSTNSVPMARATQSASVLSNGSNHKLMASGSKPCKIYYGCTPTTPAPPKGGKGGDNPSPHKFVPGSTTLEASGSKPCKIYYGCTPTTPPMAPALPAIIRS